MPMPREAASAVGAEIVKTSPPAVVVGVTLLGLGLQDWVYITAIAYAVLQSAFLIWKWVRDWRSK